MSNLFLASRHINLNISLKSLMNAFCSALILIESLQIIPRMHIEESIICLIQLYINGNKKYHTTDVPSA